jgi:DNA polymerase
MKDPMQVALASPIDVLGFRAQANSMLAHQVPPAEIEWQALVSRESGESVRGASSRPPALPSALHSIVPRSFVRLIELVVLHRDEGRFDLMYRLLWRLVHEPELAGAVGDTDMAAAKAMAQGVRRDLSRGRRAAQLRSLAPREGIALRFAWCAPQHHVTEELAQWLARTQPAAPWLLATPDRCVLWDGSRLLSGPGVPSLVAAKADDANWYRIAAQLAGGAIAAPSA